MRWAWLVALLVVGCTDAPPRATILPPGPPYPPGSLSPLRLPGPHTPRIASYRLEASYDPAQHRIAGKSVLTWTNPGPQAVRELPFHLYLNAFKNEDTLFAREARGGFREAIADEGDDGWGWIEVASASIGGKDVLAAATYAPDATVMTLPLAEPLAPGATVEVTMQFTSQLPHVYARTGWDGEFTLAGQWFPKIGVLEPGGWRCEPFHVYSEFYADFGSYDVTLDVPAGYVVAATGVLVEKTGTRQRWRADDVHDFAWMADPRMQVASGKSKDGVLVLVYHRPAQEGFAQRHVNAAIKTLDGFGELTPYPWSVMTVIDPPPGDANDGAGGMEYPTFVTTGDDAWYAPPGVSIPEFVTVHEVGHNWFQGLLASNEAHDAWLDEGVNEYADGMIMERWFGAAEGAGEALGWRSNYYEARRLAWRGQVDLVPPMTEPGKFPDYASYGSVTYVRTALALKTLEGMVGSQRMWQALAAYAQAFRWRHPQPDDFVAALGGALGRDVSWFLRPALAGTGTVELAVRDVSFEKKTPSKGVYGVGATRAVRKSKADDDAPVETVVLVENTGGVPVEVDVEVRTDDGKRQRQRWSDHGTWGRLVFPGRAVEVVVDPDDRVLLERDKLDNVWRVDAPSLPAWQTGSGIGEVQGLLLQVIGP